MASTAATDPFERNNLTPGGIRQAEQIGKNVKEHSYSSEFQGIRLPYFGARKTAEIALPGISIKKPKTLAEAALSLHMMLLNSSVSVLLVSEIKEIPRFLEDFEISVDQAVFHGKVCILLGVDLETKRVVDLSDGICQISETL